MQTNADGLYLIKASFDSRQCLYRNKQLQSTEEQLADLICSANSKANWGRL